MIKDYGYRIAEISSMTVVKAGTIRFYEECAFLEPVKRLPNGYRNYSLHHVYQVEICHFVLETFANKYLRIKSYDIIAAARQWNLPAYALEVSEYLRVIESEIIRTKEEYSSLDDVLIKNKKHKKDIKK